MKSVTIHSNLLTHAGFGLVAIMILAMGWTLYSAITSTREATESILHSERIVHTLEETSKQLNRAEASQRGYMLSSDAAYLVPRNQSIDALQLSINQLRLLAKHSDILLAQIDLLEAEFADRIALLNEHLSLYDASGYEAASDFAAAPQAQRAAVGTHRLIDQLLEQEQKHLDSQYEEEQKRFQNQLYLLALTVPLILLILFPAYLALLSQNRARHWAEHNLKAVTDGLPGVIYQFWQQPDGTNGFNFVSDGTRDLLGLEPDALQEDFSLLFDRIHKEDQQLLMDAINESAKTLRRVEVVFRFRHPDGRICSIDARSTPHRQPDGMVLWNGYWIDITEQMETRHQLAVSEQQRQMAIEVSGLGKWHWDMATDEIDWSERCHELLDLPVNTRITYSDFIRRAHPDDRDKIRSEINSCVENHSHYAAEFRVVWGDGTIHWMSVLGRISYNPDGQPGHLEGVMMDISKTKEVELALREAKDAAVSANRAKSTFLATMSHEIRTPLNGVLGMLEILSLTPLSREQLTTLEVVRQSGKSLQRLIDDILDLSKIDAEKLELYPEPVAVGTLITDVQALYDGMARSLGLELTCSVDTEISPALMIDSTRLKQVLNNLVSNALKFTKTGGISIDVKKLKEDEKTEWLQFRVTDTGIGISAELQARLFQPFTQAERSTSRHYGGTGLGLTICRRLAELMDGSIELASEVGIGTTLTLTLPFEKADPANLSDLSMEHKTRELKDSTSQRRAAPTIEEAETEGTLVLIVDDHPTNRMVLLRQLNMLGYAAECAEDGVQGLDKWQSGRFGLILCDCNMPRMDGYEMTQSIREKEAASSEARRIPIIACTANALSRDAERCLAAGMDDYLPKPTEILHLLNKLNLWLPVAERADPVGDKINAGDASGSPVLPNQNISLLDPAALAMICGDDQQQIVEILRDFRQSITADAITLEQAIEAEDRKLVTQNAHRIKGASKVVGAGQLALACARLEHASSNDKWNEILSAFVFFTEAKEQLNDHIDNI